MEKKNPYSPDFQKFRLTGLTNILVNKGCIQPLSLGMRRIFMISIYIRHKKQKKQTREDSLQNLGVIFIGCMLRQLSRKSFWDVALKRLRISRKELLGIHLRTTVSVEKNSSQEVSLDVSQSPHIECLQLISSFTW